MDKETFKALNRGDVVRHKVTGLASSYVVVANHGDRVTAIDVMEMTNPDEWDLVYRASYNKPFCRNCQDPKPGKMIHVTIERTKHRGSVTRCAYCGREITPGGTS